jgi:outer membrane murein-binding lipoprotein Lpp
MNDFRFRAGIGFALIAGGVVVAVLGYLGVSEETEVAFQLPYFASAAVGALMLLAGGSALVVSAQLQRDGDRFDELEGAVRDLAAEVGRLADTVAVPRGARAGTARNGKANGTAEPVTAPGDAPSRARASRG